MLVKINTDYIKSIDQDYKGQQRYHNGEKVKVGSIDSKYYGAEGTWQGVAKSDGLEIDVYHYMEITTIN
jgi:hypothetical protein